MAETPIGQTSVRLTANESPVKVDEQTRRFKLSDSSVALDGHTLKTDGWDLSRAKDNLPVLWAHDSETVEHVLGQWENIQVDGDALYADARFMPRSINPTAGMVLDMIDGGWLRMCSVGFIPTEGKPSKRGPGTYDFTRQTLLEASICPVGSLASALIAARSAGVDISPVKNIMEIADMPPANSPAAEEAHADPVVVEDVTRAPLKLSKRDLYDVGWLASLLQSLGYLAEVAEDESEREGDESPVPGMLLDCLKSLGAALVAMTQEEVSELLAGDVEEEDAEYAAMMMSADAETRASIIDALKDARSGRAVTITTSRGIGRIRAGKTFSRENMDALKTAHEHMCHAVETVKGLMDKGADPEDDGEMEKRAAEARARRERLAKAAQAQIAD